jgi:hypothetical protein
MARKAINKKAFEGGLVNAVDTKDIDEKSLSNATNVMCDISGRVRQMLRDQTYQIFPLNPDILEGIMTEGMVNAGFGLFCFSTDHNLDGDDFEGKIIAFQSFNKILFIEDWQIKFDDMKLCNTISDIRPSFFFIDGGLRVINSNFSHENSLNPVEDTVDDCPKIYQYIDTEWFQGEGTAWTTLKGWTANTDAIIYPPLITSTNTDQTDGAFFNEVHTHDLSGSVPTNPPVGAICVSIGCNDVITGEWDKDAAMQFGVSYIYRGITPEQDQESPIVNLRATLNTSGLTNNNHHLVFEMKANTGGQDVLDMNNGHFDPRIRGVNLYWTGSDALGDFNEPSLILTWIWDGLTYIESHTGRKYYANLFSNSQGIISTPTVEIDREPTLTYDLKNPGHLHSNESTAAKYKVSCISNRRTYIGAVNRLKFFTDTPGTRNKQPQFRQPHYFPTGINLDRMIKSPTNKFDIFPNDNIIDVALDDGDKITALEALSDRIFQFKKDILYIINASADDEYLEEEHKYLGVNNENQVVKTEYGIVWVNRNGCYKWNEDDGIVNLIDGKIRPSKPRDNKDQLDPLNPEGWENFVKDNSMIGYIPNQKQLVVFEGSNKIEDQDGNVLIYDFQTESWTRGHDVIRGGIKTNVISDYNNQILYVIQNSNDNEDIEVTNITEPDPGINPQWNIYNCNAVESTISQLKIGSTMITPSFNYDAQTNGLFADYIKAQIESYNYSDKFNVIVNNTTVLVTMLPYKLTDTGDTWVDQSGGTGNQTMAWDTTSDNTTPGTSNSFSIVGLMEPGVEAYNAVYNPYNGSCTGNLMIKRLSAGMGGGRNQRNIQNLLDDPVFMEMGDTSNDELDNGWDGQGGITDGILVNWINSRVGPNASDSLWNDNNDSNKGGVYHPGFYSFILSKASARGRQNKFWDVTPTELKPRLQFLGITEFGANTSLSIDLWDNKMWSGWNATTPEPGNNAGDIGPYTYLRMSDDGGQATENWVSMAALYAQGTAMSNGIDNGTDLSRDLPTPDAGFSMILREGGNHNTTYFGDNTAGLARFTAMKLQRIFIFRCESDDALLDDEKIKICFIDNGAYSNPDKAGPTFSAGEEWSFSGTGNVNHDTLLTNFIINDVETFTWGGDSDAPTSAVSNAFTMVTLLYSDQSQTVKDNWNLNSIMSIAVPSANTITATRTAEAVAEIDSHFQDGVVSTPKVIGFHPKRNWQTQGNTAFSSGVSYRVDVNGATGNNMVNLVTSDTGDTDWNIAQRINEQMEIYNFTYPWYLIGKSNSLLTFTTTIANNPVIRVSDTVFTIAYTSANEKTPEEQGFKVGDQIKFQNVGGQATNALIDADKIYKILTMVDGINLTTITIASSANAVDGTIVSNALGATNATYNHTLMVGSCATLTTYDESEPNYHPTEATATTIGSLEFTTFTNNPSDILDSQKTSDSVIVQTKDFDGGNSTSIKKFYKVILSIKSNTLSGLNVYLVKNQRFDARIALSTDSSSSSVHDWTNITYKSTVPISANTFGISIEGSGNIHGFQLNDIVIHYRETRSIASEDG